MENSTSNSNELPQFSQINIDEIEFNIDNILTQNRKKIAALLNQAKFTWENLMFPLEQLGNQLINYWAPISHLNSVCNSDTLRKVYALCLQKISEYEIEIGQNQALYAAVKAIKDSKAYDDLGIAEKKIIEDNLRDFRLSGVNLPEAEKKHFIQLDKQLTELTTKFENNLLDATDHWYKHIDDETLLSGIPPRAIEAAKQEAQKKGLDGWVFNLEFPSFIAVMTYADSEQLRKEVYTAFFTRASDQGPTAGQWDNSQVMDEILSIRHEMAKLVGFANYAEYSLATKMAPETDKVVDFLQELAEASQAHAKQDFEELSQFAKQQHNHDALNTWDLTYYSEKLQQKKYSISQEELRPYFPENNVVTGLFSIVGRLFNIRLEEINKFDSWHDDVRLFKVYDHENQFRGHVYMDLYSRPQKRGGAWVGDCHNRCRLDDGSTQNPVTFLVCNFSRPTASTPALLSHDEVITLFHEFGHALHHLLTKVEYPSISGTNGVEWDAVELPSQFLENWCWEKEALALLSSHYETDEPIPDEMYQRMIKAKNFQSGMQMVRQVEFSLFDFRIHQEFSSEKGGRIQQILDEVRAQVGVVPIPKFNRFQHSFAHIFAGGYAAGYYSYKWAEVLSSDAFSKFEEKGIFDTQTGLEFLQNILEKGGSEKALDLFVAFRGREPKIDALLRHSGLT